MKQILSLEQAVSKIRDGMTVMVGGFMCCGTPLKLVRALAQSGVRDLTVIANDAGFPGVGVGALLEAGCVRALVATHIGLNHDAGTAMNDGALAVTLVPQGTLAERIRTAGSGLGGVLTPTGVGTIVEEGKRRIAVGGKDYLLETPIRADVSLISGYRVDGAGNVFCRGSARNFNPLMATAAELVIVEADALAERIEPESAHIPGLFVDYVVDGGALI